MKKHLSLNRRDFLQETTVAGAALVFAPGMLSAADNPTGTTPLTGKIRVGVIGCGSVSRLYLPELLSHPFIEVASVCDIVPDRAKNAAAKFKVPHFYPEIGSMLAGAPFDLLVNLTSMQAHYTLNRRALEAKRHVWTEKPMATEVAQGRELLGLAKKNGVQIWPAPTCVTSPAFRFMAETIASGKLGRVTAAHGAYGHNGPGWSAWFYEQGGGSLYDLGVYNITTLTGLLGPVTEVVGMSAVIHPTRRVQDKGEIKVEADENSMLIMHHGNGVFSHVQTGFSYFGGSRLPGDERKLHTIDVIGTRGTMHLQGFDWAPAGVDLATVDQRTFETHARDTSYQWVAGASHMAECLLTGKASLITPEHGLHVLEVMNGCHESQRTGRRIRIESKFPWPVIS
jgi:predicted dehydrogenase